ALSAVAVVAAWRHASSLRVGAPEPVTAFAGERFVLDVPIMNLARSAVAFDVLLGVGASAKDHGRIGALLPRLDAGERRGVSAVHPMLRRGLHPQGTLELASAFPLGLWTCVLRFALPNEILVLPRLGTLRRVDRRGVRVRGLVGYDGRGRGDENEV